jgi:hypothetical protein
MPNNIQASGAGDAKALTKSDTTVYAQPYDALYVGGEGDAALRVYPGGQTVTFAGAAAGSIIPVRFDMLMSTNTDATLCVGLRF